MSHKDDTMTSTGILMTPENAQKSHAMKKTQTRRIIRLQPAEGARVLGPEMYEPCIVDNNGHLAPGREVFGVYSDDGEWGVKCPFGRVGNRLWVREAWCVGRPALPSGAGIIPFYGPVAAIDRTVCTKVVHRGAWLGGDEPKWRSGLFMPKWACRTWLAITEIRVQRLQEISDADVIAEGIDFVDGMGVGHSGYRHCQSHGFVYKSPVRAFQVLWESINGSGSWDANPWVWSLSFRRIDESPCTDEGAGGGDSACM